MMQKHFVNINLFIIQKIEKVCRLVKIVYADERIDNESNGHQEDIRKCNSFYFNLPVLKTGYNLV